ncbi:MAG TPA: LamG-like jellyroll fold domain-containing protein [Polyangiaceae bacterium]|nr:LamG-like jellyroll fold domain-containing protein [Polyangiaceae bacterium]
MNHRRSTIWYLFASLGFVIGPSTGCSNEGSQIAAQLGALQLALTGSSTSGLSYRLRDGVFQITGASTATLTTEADPNAATLTVDLTAGSYLIDLQSGWRLERKLPDGTYEVVESVLVSTNPTGFTVVDQQTTNVRFRFTAGDEAVELGFGRLVLGIDVDDQPMGTGGSGAGGGGSGGTPAGLIFYSTLDSPAAIQTPEVGPVGVFRSGEFVPGRRGQAYSTSGSEQVVFPAVSFPGDRGTVEFWGKLQGYAASEVIPWGNSPYFVTGFGLNGNDGGSGGGLVVAWDGKRAVTNCFTTSVTYGSILGDTQAWHHYAFAWDVSGISGSAYHIQMYLDGSPIGSPIIYGNNADFASFPAFVGDLLVAHNQNPEPGKSVAVDELKLWNYAKSDFSDSLNP